MSSSCCSEIVKRHDLKARQRFGRFSWLIPCGGFMLIPKCPACFAAYITLATGVGISTSTASIARSILIGLLVMLLYSSVLRPLARFKSLLRKTQNEQSA